MESDKKLIEKSDYILSIVPPRDAFSTAHRITSALSSFGKPYEKLLYYVDLNAISPATATKIAESFSNTMIRFVDGGVSFEQKKKMGTEPFLNRTEDHWRCTEAHKRWDLVKTQPCRLGP